MPAITPHKTAGDEAVRGGHAEKDEVPELAAVEITAHGLSHVLRAMQRMPWAILPHKLEEILAFLEVRATGTTLTAAEIRARIGNAPRPAPSVSGAIAVLPVNGILMPKANMMTEISGGTSVQKLAADFKAFAADPQVDGILLDVNSPGGSVYGIEELAAEIHATAQAKPVWAIANPLAASAAYWLASQAGKFVATPSGDVGSIGVRALHTDYSKALEMEGVKKTYVSAGKYKTVVNDAEPLSEEGLAVMQQFVNDVYDEFVDAVARGRRVSADAVRNGYGEGQLVHAARALRMGMIDEKATFDQVLTQMQREIAPSCPGRSRADGVQPPAEAAAVAASARTGALARLRLRNETAKRRTT